MLTRRFVSAVQWILLVAFSCGASTVFAQQVVVPKVVDLLSDAAFKALTNAGLQYKIQMKGNPGPMINFAIIVQQNPAAGQKVAKGSVVLLVGVYSQYSSLEADQNLTLGGGTQVAVKKEVAQKELAKQLANSEQVAIAGPRVPTVVGMSLTQAKKALDESKCRYGVKTQEFQLTTIQSKDNTVSSQTPAGGKVLAPNESVVLVLFKYQQPAKK